MADVNPEGKDQGEEKFNVSTWLPECYVDTEPAVCELIPCGHFISIGTARSFAEQIRTGRRAANPNKCPICRSQWSEIRCLSVEASITKIRKNLDDYTRNIPDGPLRIWFQQILHFFTSENNALDSDLKGDIGKCLVDSFIKRGGRGNILAITNNTDVVVALIRCVDIAVNDWINSNFGSDRAKAIAAQKEGVLGGTYGGSPIEWLLEKSESLNTAAIKQAQSVHQAANNTVIFVHSIINKLSEGITGGARRVAQVPGQVTTAALAAAALIGTAKMYGDIDRSTCAELSKVQERGPDVPMGRWEGYSICEEPGILGKYKPEFCCDPTEHHGLCRSTDLYPRSYHHKDYGQNKYKQNFSVPFDKKLRYQPGRFHVCDGFSNAPGCPYFWNHGDESWEPAKGAEFVLTGHVPGPLLPSEQEQCHTTLDNQEAAGIVGAAVSVGVLLYGLYRACTESRPSAPDLVGDDTLVITPNGRVHRGGSKYSIKRRRRQKKTWRKKSRRKKSRRKRHRKKRTRRR